MSFDLYSYLKLENRTQRLYTYDPNIYIYDNLMYRLDTMEPIIIVEPTIDLPLDTQFNNGWPGFGKIFRIYDDNKRPIYYEFCYASRGQIINGNQQYTYNYETCIYQYDDIGYLLKTYMFRNFGESTSYIIWEYEYDKDIVVANTYSSNDNSLIKTVQHVLSKVINIVCPPKN